MRTKVLLSVLVLFSLLASCNMPTAGQPPVTQPPQNQPVSVDPNALATAVELTAIARVTEIAGSAVPATATFTTIPPADTATSTPTTAVVSGPCSPTITATVNANVRSGPDTAYDVIGSLMLGQTATIVGRNDAYTWWYIDYPGVAGNHAWIAGSVVTSACVPSVVQVVAAPPLPTPTEVLADNNDSSSGDSNGGQNGNNLLPLQPLVPLKPLLLLKPDLVVTGMQVAPKPAKMGQPVSVQVTVANQGTAAASNFSVQWWSSWALVSCNWSISSLAAGESKTRTCTYTYPGCSNYDIKAVVDGGALVKESNEDNNSFAGTLLVKCQ